MNRKIYYWKLPSAELSLGERTLVMGVLNVTPDSFSDGGLYSDPEQACARALEMEEQGADIIDIGAESTRPDSKRISAEEEWRRLLPVLKLLRGRLTAPLSLDTYKSEIAERALEYGVSIFNDPSGLTFDANLARVAAENNAGLILNHMRGTPESWGKLPSLPDVIGAVAKDLEATVSRARRAGVEKNRIVVDPGLGFGKRREQNSEILAHLERLAELDFPILVGPSRKSFLSHAAEGETLFATAAAVTAAVLHGAHIVRVHDVKEMRGAVQIADEILRVASSYRAAEEANEQAAAARNPRPRADSAYTEAKPAPPRPPLLRREPPPPIEMPKPAEEAPERPVFRRPAADRPPQRRDSGDRPPRRDFERRPAAAPRGDRPRSDGPGPDRPRNDRPPRPFGDRPPRPFGDRPDRRPEERRGEGRPSAFRPGGERPGNDGARNDRPRNDQPRGDRPRNARPAGDRPRGDRPPGGAPPRGAGPNRPPGDKPRRPFRKRP